MSITEDCYKQYINQVCKNLNTELLYNELSVLLLLYLNMTYVSVYSCYNFICIFLKSITIQVTFTCINSTVILLKGITERIVCWEFIL